MGELYEAGLIRRTTTDTLCHELHMARYHGAARRLYYLRGLLYWLEGARREVKLATFAVSMLTTSFGLGNPSANASQSEGEFHWFKAVLPTLFAIWFSLSLLILHV